MDLSGPGLTFLSFVLYAALHSLLATRRVKSWAISVMGRSGERAYRLIYNLIGAVTFIPVLAVPAMNPGDPLYRIHGLWLILSTLLQLAGAIIILAGMLQTDIWHFLGLRQLFEPEAAGDRLVVGGLYRYMRHPLYSGGLLLIWFLPMMTTSLLAFNLAASVYLYIGSLFEEKRLIAEFGELYVLYQQQVPRFIPGLRRISRT